VIRCEVTKDIPADDELVAMLTVSQAGPRVSSSPSVMVMDADACTSAPAAASAAEAPSLSPVNSHLSPAARGVDAGGDIDGKSDVDASTRLVISAPVESADCRPCPAPIPSEHNITSISRKKDKTTNHSHLATPAAISSDIDQQKRSFCKYHLIAVWTK